MFEFTILMQMMALGLSSITLGAVLILWTIERFERRGLQKCVVCHQAIKEEIERERLIQAKIDQRNQNRGQPVEAK